MNTTAPQAAAPMRVAVSFARMLVLAQRRFRARQQSSDPKAPSHPVPSR